MNANATVTVHHEVEVSKAPRTRRQLREALRDETIARLRAEELATTQKAAAAAEAKENRRIRADLAAATTALDKIGYEPSIERRLAADLGLIRPAEEWQPKQGLTPTLTATEHEKILDQRVGEAVDTTRRSTLAAVIKALQITGYGALTTTALNRPETKITHQITDHFWADIQTALEVREEKRAAEERAATEKKVAGLAPAQQLSFFFPRDGFDATAPRVSDLPFSRAFRTGGLVPRIDNPFTAEDIENVRKAADDLGVADAATFSETVQKFTDSTAAPKKKPAKKKSEGKK